MGSLDEDYQDDLSDDEILQKASGEPFRDMSCMGARMGLGMFAGEVLQFMESPEYNRFTHIVFDTAPTLKKKITAAASAFTSVFDKKEMQQQGPSNELDQLKDRMEKVLNVFCDVDTTEFVIVTIPTPGVDPIAMVSGNSVQL
ncbi:hypothetical protein DY000_02047671 [Brassica cretica]|uniref:Anion-transporting ATPase-like domain-containing protein n=1 Tax=Brassica cretica TaxID=69181 RepID=A0ABQ7F5V5_BRACR|nr:hypothetical protein DY000_02047671 [Brassica cretica]